MNARTLRRACWKLLRAGLVSLRYEQGEEVWMPNPDLSYTQDEMLAVLKAIEDAGEQGATSQEIAATLGYPVLKVRAITGDY